MCTREVSGTVTGSGLEPVVARGRRSVECTARPGPFVDDLFGHRSIRRAGRTSSGARVMTGSAGRRVTLPPNPPGTDFTRAPPPTPEGHTAQVRSVPDLPHVLLIEEEGGPSLAPASGVTQLA